MHRWSSRGSRRPCGCGRDIYAPAGRAHRDDWTVARGRRRPPRCMRRSAHSCRLRRQSADGAARLAARSLRPARWPLGLAFHRSGPRPGSTPPQSERLACTPAERLTEAATPPCTADIFHGRPFRWSCTARTDPSRRHADGTRVDRRRNTLWRLLLRAPRLHSSSRRLLSRDDEQCGRGRRTCRSVQAAITNYLGICRLAQLLRG